MKYITGRKVNVRTIRKIQEGQGLTLKNGKIVEYKTGWQVGMIGIKCQTPEEVANFLHRAQPKSCGIWLSDGIYYVDYGKRVTTKKDALELGRLCDQQEIYGWAPRKHGQCVKVTA